MQKFSLPAIATAAVMLGAMSAQADTLLGTAFFPIEVIDPAADLNRAQFMITDAFGTGSAVSLFGGVSYQTANAPTSVTLVVGAGGSAEANNFAALLTNGNIDTIEMFIGLRNSADLDSGGAFTRVGEKERFNLAANDFAGYTISKIVFNLSSLTFVASGTGTRATFDANVQVFTLTPMPEPGMLLGGIAMVAMTGLCRPRRSKSA